MTRDVPVKRHRLILEGFNCIEFPTVQYVYDFMEVLSKRIDMRILVPPVVVRVPVVSCVDDLKTKDFGVSAQMIWLESGCRFIHGLNITLLLLICFLVNSLKKKMY